MKLLLLTISLSLLLGSLAHKCIHDKLNVSLKQIPNPAKHLTFGEKQVTQLSYESIRIHPDYSALTAGTEEIREYVRNQLMPSAISFFSATLKVRRLQERLKIDFPCADLNPPADLATQGVDADLVILVTAARYDEPFVAAALPCGLVDPDQRPGYGGVYFNLNYLDVSSASSLEENLSTTLHEMTHVLGFANYMYEYYINPLTGIPLTGHVKTKTVNGQLVTYINLDPLTRRVRQHFGCSAIEGAYLENEGSEGSAGSHFERRVFMNEFMTASTVTDPIISEFTLALLEGSGWYQVDYSKTEPFFWGKSEGCSFLDGPCLDNNAKPKFDEFCSPLSRIGCSFTARSVAVCGTIGSVKRDPTLSPSLDYWHNQTVVLDPFGDNCPYYMGFSFADCENEENQLNAFLDEESYGHTSRCFGGTLSKKSSSSRHLGFCFPTQCSAQGDGYVVKVTVGSTIITCVREEMVTVPGLQGYMECPDPNDFCAKANPIYCEKGCAGRGTCVNRKCQCPEGWGGSDCGLRVYKDGCQRCKGNSENTACFGDGCWCNPSSGKCTGQTLIGNGGTYTSTNDQDSTPSPDQNKNVSPNDGRAGIFIWIVVCVIILAWRTKVARDNR